MGILFKILIIGLILAPTMITSIIWSGVSAGAIWGTSKIDKATGIKLPVMPSIISLIIGILLFGGSGFGTFLIIKLL